MTQADIDYASIYDSFTITVLETIEDLGFCEKGKGGAFVADGALVAPHGKLPFNTDGGGLCNNHPANRGGMTKVIEAVRQLRGEANARCRCPTARSRSRTAPAGSLGTRIGSRDADPRPGGRMSGRRELPNLPAPRRSTRRPRSSGPRRPRAGCC